MAIVKAIHLDLTPLEGRLLELILTNQVRVVRLKGEDLRVLARLRAKLATAQSRYGMKERKD